MLFSILVMNLVIPLLRTYFWQSYIKNRTWQNIPPVKALICLNFYIFFSLAQFFVVTLQQ